MYRFMQIITTWSIYMPVAGMGESVIDIGLDWRGAAGTASQ